MGRILELPGKDYGLVKNAVEMVKFPVNHLKPPSKLKSKLKVELLSEEGVVLKKKFRSGWKDVVLIREIEKNTLKKLEVSWQDKGKTFNAFIGFPSNGLRAISFTLEDDGENVTVFFTQKSIQTQKGYSRKWVPVVSWDNISYYHPYGDLESEVWDIIEGYATLFVLASDIGEEDRGLAIRLQSNAFGLFPRTYGEGDIKKRFINFIKKVNEKYGEKIPVFYTPY